MKSYMAKANEIEKKWFVVDAEGKTLGRLSTQIAMILMGKHKPEYTSHVDTGDYVIVINADKVTLTGKKWDQEFHVRHTGYPGGQKKVSLRTVLQKHPERLIEHSVKGMLPKNRLGRQMYKKLKVYAGTEHQHQAQKPEMLEL